jgi:hypothetical protein
VIVDYGMLTENELYNGIFYGKFSKPKCNYSANFRQVTFYPLKSIIKIPINYYRHYTL